VSQVPDGGSEQEYGGKQAQAGLTSFSEFVNGMATIVHIFKKVIVVGR
jgi:hypothetical protein